jgi:hypothetical protein
LPCPYYRFCPPRCRASSTPRIVVTTAYLGCNDSSSLCHPSRWSTGGVADHGNRESQLRTDRADAQAVKPHNCGAERLSWRPDAAVSALPLVPLGPIRHDTLAGLSSRRAPSGKVSGSRWVRSSHCAWASLPPKTTHRLSLDASGVLNIVTTMTCNSSAPGTTSTAYKKGRS